MFAPTYLVWSVRADVAYLWISQCKQSATSSKFGVLKLSRDIKRGYPRLFMISVKAGTWDKEQV
jgi:hypothetical protein